MYELHLCCLNEQSVEHFDGSTLVLIYQNTREHKEKPLGAGKENVRQGANKTKTPQNTQAPQLQGRKKQRT